MRFHAKICENIAKSRQKMIPEYCLHYVYLFLSGMLFIQKNRVKQIQFLISRHTNMFVLLFGFYLFRV